ncbi:MAG: NlpC/P60 family protein [Bacteroidota bacterium]
MIPSNRILLLYVVGLISLMGCKDSISSYGASNILIPKEYLALEEEHIEMLKPIESLKENDPKIYWFIVSWLNTNYNTPIWKGYGTENWKNETKKRGIDCSGFARVMQDQIFSKKVRGGSQGILDTYCKRISTSKMQMGDLVFFKAPYGKTNRIVHVGVFIKDGYFVHATSNKSASKGLGLMINSLEERNWAADFVTAGRVKE